MAPYLGHDNPLVLSTAELPLPSFSKAFPHFYEDPEAMSNDIDPFTVNCTTGFLPNKLPNKTLPDDFQSLQKIVEEMSVVKLNGSAGLLSNYQLGDLIDSGNALPDLTDCIDNLKVNGTGNLDLHLVTALFRDYSFLASAYLLEPCWKTWNSQLSTRPDDSIPTPSDGEPNSKQTTVKHGCPHEIQGSLEYGLGRTILPACIARPLVKLADILSIPPFMSYAASYALYNYYLDEETKGHEDYSNLRLIRAFERGLDPHSSEAGFVLTHIHMVALTGPLLKGVIDVLERIENLRTSPSSEDSEQVLHIKSSLRLVLGTMEKIEANMERMWSNSMPKDYPSYRTFIFGITSQPLFPNGVVYEGCFDDKPVDFRGESGANDSIIPLLDNLCQVPMPKNPLTHILREFRGKHNTASRPRRLV